MPALDMKTPRQRRHAPGPDTGNEVPMPEQAYKCCTRCGEEKPLEQFYANRRSRDGKQSACKPCMKAAKNAWEKRNRDKVNARKRRYYQRRPEVVRRHVDKWTAKYPERRQAAIHVMHALRDGKLKRGSRCERCAREGRIEGHHRDYSKPLEVEWLCPVCHEVADEERRCAEALNTVLPEEPDRG
jgi:hypothetical protein